RLLLGPAGAVAMLAGGLLATASSANASILASSRINFAMGRDKILTPQINEVHPRFGTPYRAIAITGGLILLFIAAGNVTVLAAMGSVLHLVIYALLNVALIVMREADAADYDPTYTVPLYPITPIAGAILSTALIVFIDPNIVLVSGGLVAAAIVWYLGYARTRTTTEGILSEYIVERQSEMPDSVVSAATSVQPDGGEYRVMVPLSNPESETDLISLASAVAKQRGGTVDAVHVITVPDQTSLQYAKDHVEEFEEDYHAVLDAAREDAETFGVDIETHTVISHRGYAEIFDAARTHDADLVVMGWGGGQHGSAARVESRSAELGSDLPCDFVAVKDRGFDPEHILLPTAGGPESDLSAEIATMLRAEYDSEITLLHVADDQSEGVTFLDEWASDHGLSDVNLRVETGDPETAIERAAADCSMVVLGATERGLLSRIVNGSSIMDVVEEVDCSVLLAERPTGRSLRERLFG
ncbi:MAG: amino acid permease, partial [Halobaculum sp.]